MDLLRGRIFSPARTGKLNKSKKAVIYTAHTNNGKLDHVIPGLRIFIIVVMKLMAPNIEEAPAICKLNIAKSTEAPEWASIEDNGG